MRLLKIFYIRMMYSLHKPISNGEFFWNTAIWIITGLCIIAYQLSPWMLLIPVLFAV